MFPLTHPTSLIRPSVDTRSAPSEQHAASSTLVTRYPVTRVRTYTLAAHHSLRATEFPNFLATEGKAYAKINPVSCGWRRSRVGQPHAASPLDARISATSDCRETTPVEESCHVDSEQSTSGHGLGDSIKETVQAGDQADSNRGNTRRNKKRWLGMFSSSDLQPLAAGLVLMAAFALSAPRRVLALDGSPPTAPPPVSSALMVGNVEAASAGAGKTAEVVAEVTAEVVAEVENLTKLFEAARKEQDSSAKLLEWEKTAGTADVATLKDQLKRQLLSGRFHEALVTLERLIELEPTQEEWVIVAAQTLIALGDTQRAKNIYNEILQINPYSPRALQGLTAIMQSVGEDSLVLGLIEGKVQQATEAGLQPEAVNLKLLLGQVHTLQGNVAAALAEYEQVSKEVPGDFRPYLCQGLVYILMGDKEKADASFLEFQERCPKDFPLLSTVDDILMESKLATRRMEAQQRQGGHGDASKKSPPSLNQPTFPTSAPGEDAAPVEE